mgnify:CR=1 FL=1
MKPNTRLFSRKTGSAACRICLGLSLALAAPHLTGCAAFAPNQGARAAAAAESGELGRLKARRELGIEIAGIRLSAAGYMLDLRYRVTDPEKAAPLMDRRIKPYLVDQASGGKLLVPATAKLGSLRQTPRANGGDRTYFMLFANPGRFLRPGDKVTLVVGDAQVENLKVE